MNFYKNGLATISSSQAFLMIQSQFYFFPTIGAIISSTLLSPIAYCYWAAGCLLSWHYVNRKGCI